MPNTIVRSILPSFSAFSRGNWKPMFSRRAVIYEVSCYIILRLQYLTSVSVRDKRKANPTFRNGKTPGTQNETQVSWARIFIHEFFQQSRHRFCSLVENCNGTWCRVSPEYFVKYPSPSKHFHLVYAKSHDVVADVHSMHSKSPRIPALDSYLASSRLSSSDRIYHAFKVENLFIGRASTCFMTHEGSPSRIGLPHDKEYAMVVDLFLAQSISQIRWPNISNWYRAPRIGCLMTFILDARRNNNHVLSRLRGIFIVIASLSPRFYVRSLFVLIPRSCGPRFSRWIWLIRYSF